MSSFQSHLGLILTHGKDKEWVDALDNLSIPSWSDFNLASKVSHRWNHYQDFQSHLGLILTKEFFCYADKLYGFQSHLGLILTREYRLMLLGVLSFQSHLGLILTVKAREDIIFNLQDLSIPSWSDFNSTHSLPHYPLSILFQSHLGLILTRVSVQR